MLRRNEGLPDPEAGAGASFFMLTLSSFSSCLVSLCVAVGLPSSFLPSMLAIIFIIINIRLCVCECRDVCGGGCCGSCCVLEDQRVFLLAVYSRKKARRTRGRTSIVPLRVCGWRYYKVIERGRGREVNRLDTHTHPW